MNQIKRKRRLSPLEAAVLGNILYLVIVLIFKGVFDVIRTDNFNYLFSGVQLLTVGIFWIALFVICFKNIGANEKPKTLKYIFFSLIPIVVLSVLLTAVSVLAPGQDTSSVWNQFAFLAAPTIFWYLPFGLIYQLIGSNISIFIFFGISLIFTVVFQLIGIVLGRIIGHKYLEETKAENEKEIQEDLNKKKEKKKNKKKSRLPKRTSIGIDGLSDEMINEGFTPKEPVSMNMTGVIIEDAYPTGNDKELYIDNDQERIIEPKTQKNESGLFERIASVDERTAFSTEIESIEPKRMPEIKAKDNEKTEKTTVANEWDVTEPMTLEQAEEEMRKHQESNDKSFLKETSAIRIINEEDIEEYYRNKK
ncbi:hypothetical protein GH810_09115 [Acetobacterium paludosum]|uniref:Uncharacterized protein n=1 Tax=Acetobacterium paludosum TaxID=52693 RepID=A0A923HUB8_9FIRM|nr:CPBP family intramembrane metalloprotease [Acetobacterium paludosum]MBC3888466.1 hypothetical protein [Acetobacterium paludosum]